ncbi:hypothetical protein [Luteococcus japonicus]|uniref:hypothetical protein n=1 Tax=Luteococcus japonicus TaxID=33984 RepID=UPI0011CE25DE|nr:hypothetical protein [Luteococcus japonicus]
MLQIFLMLRVTTGPSVQYLLRTLTILIADIETMDSEAWKRPAARKSFCTQLESVARETEAACRPFMIRDDVWRRNITDEMRRRADYLRQFNGQLFSPTPTTRAELVGHLAPLLATMAEGRWLDLPEASLSEHSPKREDTFRTWLLALALVGAVAVAQHSFGSWAGTLTTALLGLPLALLLKKLGLTMGDVVKG